MLSKLSVCPSGNGKWDTHEVVGIFVFDSGIYWECVWECVRVSNQMRMHNIPCAFSIIYFFFNTVMAQSLVNGPSFH